MHLLGIDIGTTNCKVGLFAADGRELAIVSRPTPYRRAADGYGAYEPEGLWQTVLAALQEVLRGPEGRGEPIRAIGIASMAETGLLLDAQTGEPRTDFLPWFDDRAREHVDTSAGGVEPVERFRRTGLRPSFKYGLPKILWLREKERDVTDGALWLSAADYIAYRLTGVCGTDYTLAARTYGFRIDTKTWDEELLESLGLSPAIFPEAFPSGYPLGNVASRIRQQLNLDSEVPVAVSGHDHISAALAVGAVEPGVIYDSMGTAETLIGTLPERPLGEKEYSSGLTFGLHVVPGCMFWLGGLSSSGGSIEWMRGLLGKEPLSYQEVEAVLAEVPPGPTGIIYLPYLAGSGAPLPDQAVRGALIGLDKRHKHGEILRAVLEGTAYEMEAIRRSAQEVGGIPIDQITAVGGGTRNQIWLQLKADISGCEYFIPSLAEATLLGAALTAGFGCGALSSDDLTRIAARQRRDGKRVVPDMERHRAYRYWYENAYTRLQNPLRDYYNTLARDARHLTCCSAGTRLCPISGEK